MSILSKLEFEKKFFWERQLKSPGGRSGSRKDNILSRFKISDLDPGGAFHSGMLSKL